MKKLLSLFLVLVMLVSMFAGLGTTALAADTDGIWVDPVNGSDSNSGAYGSPLKTIEAAKSKAAAASADGDVTVWLMDGTYAVTEAIEFTSADSGKNGHTITYKAAAGAAPVISGGKEVTGWTLHDAQKNIYVADVPEGAEYSRQFYVDGEHQTRAMTEVSPTEWKLFGAKGYVSPTSNTQDTNEYLILDLGESKSVNYLTVYTGSDADRNGRAAGFPQDFTVETSSDNAAWQTVYTATGYTAPTTGTAATFTFPATDARYVKLNVTKLGAASKLNPGKYTLSVSELEAGLDDGGTATDFTALQIDYSKNLMDKLEAIGHKENPDWNDLANSPAANLFDGDLTTSVTTLGYWQQWLVDHDGSCAPYVVTNVSKDGASVEIAAITVSVLSYNQPSHFTLEVSEQDAPTEEDWTVITEQTDFDWDTDKTATFVFEPVKAKKVRLRATDLANGGVKSENSTDGYEYRLTLAEFAAWAAKEPDTSGTVEVDETNDLLKPGCVVGIFHNSPKYESFNFDEAGTFALDNLVDGNEIATFITSKSYSDVNQLVGRGGADTPWVEVKVSESKPVTVAAVRVVVRPRVVPSSFMIQASVDGVNWSTVVDKTDFDWSTEKTAETFQFTPVQATRLRFVCRDLEKLVEDEAWYFQLMEMEAFSVKTAVAYDDSVNLIDAVEVLGHNESHSYTPETAENNLTYLTDNDLTTFATTNPYYKDWITDYGGSISPWLSVNVSDGGQSVDVAAVRVAVDDVNQPTSFTIELTQDATSENDGNWTVVQTVRDYDWSESKDAVFTFTPQKATKVRLRATKLANGIESPGTGSSDGKDYSMRLTEFAVYAPEDTSGTADYTTDLLSAATADNVLFLGYTNSSTNETVSYIHGGTPAANLFDGSSATFLSTGGLLGDWMKGNGGPLTIILQVKLADAAVKVGGVKMTPRDNGVGRPTDFTIQTSTDGETWKTVQTLTDYDWSAENAGFITFKSTSATQLRFLIEKTENPEGTDYFFQISGLAAYPGAASAASEPSGSLIYVTQGGAEKYTAADVTALHDNSDYTYAADQAINGLTWENIERYGYDVPESFGLKDFKNTDDMEIQILRWWYHRIIKNSGVSEDGTKLYLDEDWLTTYQDSSFADRITWLENAYEFIDQTGEWYIDRTEKKIYYKPDGTMSGKTAIVPVTEQLIVFEGCENIAFDGVKFENTSWLTPNTLGYHDAQSGTYTQHNGVWGDVPGAIETHAAKNITITNSELCNLGGGGIRIGNGSSGCKITNSAIHDISSSGIWVGNNTGHNHGSCEAGTDVTDILIQNNYVTRTGLDIFDASAICVLYSSNTVIDHNEVCNTSYTGISLGWGWDWKNAPCSGNNTVSNNYIHDTGKTVHDGGCFYSLGLQPGTKVFGNYVHTHSDGLYDKDGGLYTDEGSTGMELYNNVVGDGVYWWRKIWTGNIKDCNWHDNFYCVNRDWNDGTNITSTNNTYVEDGDFSKYEAAQAIIDNAGLIDESVKAGVRVGIADKHNVVLTQYPDCEAYYFAKSTGLLTFNIAGQVGSTQYNKLARTVNILMPEGTDLTALAGTYTAAAGFTCDKASGSTQDFSSPVVYTFSDDEQSYAWTVTVKCEVTTSGEPTGTELTLDTAIQTPADWTQQPTATEDGGALFTSAKGFSTYIGQRIANDTILEFDVQSALDGNDWTGYALRMQNPNGTLDTMYHVVFKQDVVELQKWVDGNRTMLIGTIEGYPSAFGDIANDYYTSDVRHSIKTGAIDVPTGVRLFLYVDGNKVFDVIDADSPITEDGFFGMYPMTHNMTLYPFTNIQRKAVNFADLEAAVALAEEKNAEEYTAASFADLEAALDAAKDVLADKTATQVQVDAALKALNDALNGLIEVTYSDKLTITRPTGTVYPYSNSVKAYLQSDGGDVYDYREAGSMEAGDASIAPVLITWSDSKTSTATKYVVEYATKADYSDALTVTLETNLTDKVVKVYNLYKATKYYLRVTAYAGTQKLDEATSTFETADLGARIMNIDSVYNVRDLGGYKTESGKTTRQGLIFRGSELDGEHGLHLSAEGNAYMSNVLGIKLDMDLRADDSPTPLSSATKISYGINGYSYAFTETEKYRQIFEALSDEANYPIYVHCWGGADRTGTVCYLLNALLGVSEEELIQDFELTSWSIFDVRTSDSEDFTNFVAQLKTYEGDTLSEKTKNYLLSIGVTEAQISNIFTIMLAEDETDTPEPDPDPNPNPNPNPDPTPNPGPIYLPTILPTLTWTNPYTDVSVSDSFYDAVQFVTAEGLMNGVSKNQFAPYRSLTRGMLVTILYRMEGEPAVTADAPFTDLTQDWYRAAVIWAAQNGIVNGVGHGKFAPEQALTNEQLMVILHRYAGGKGYQNGQSKDLTAFEDAGSVSGWATEAMKWAAAMNFLSGKTLNATTDAIRADIAQTLMLFCKAYRK